MVKIVPKLKTKRARLKHFTQEMYKQNLELAEQNKTLTFLSQIDELVLGSSNKNVEVSQTIAELLANEPDFILAAVYVADKTRAHATLEGISAGVKSSSETLGILRQQLVTLSLHHEASDVVSKVVQTGDFQLLTSFSQLGSSINESADKRIKTSLGVQSLFLCPLKSAGGVIGLLILGVGIKEEDVPSSLRNLVGRLVTTISVAVENHLLYERLQAAGSRLEMQNKKLRELDKTKDEFISLASHQLRTPLTTVKGYLSMVLEGDAGPIKENQKDLLQHAFEGANSMVYLISDLLNVSRLQNSKFVIDNKPTNLGDVAADEIAQLKSQAAGKGVELLYKRPANFPVLNLDETKIRQVIMNFLDNAIYYTPRGGKVKTAISATNDSITCTVTDNGMGVPEESQHKLFTKFYRAENARKMRPDGTGLGLFMARKIIVAQGGAIVFNSTDGKGSTFGFTFPRKAIELKDKNLRVPTPDDKGLLVSPPPKPTKTRS